MANANPLNFEERWNSHRILERFIRGQHVSLRENMPRLRPDPMVKYITKTIPPYPSPVEFWVSDVAHVTEKSGFEGILESEQFRPPSSEFSWWDLKITQEEIRAAEIRYVERNFPNEAQELKFLEKFTTSPLFQLQKSRYGNYRFTFPLADLMQCYKEQNCGGKEPILRVFETITYKQGIVYTVLIHSPDDNERFRGYPLLETSDWVRYQDGQIVWKAQAICETHRYRFDEKTREVRESYPEQFYVWDQVSLVFHLPDRTKLLKAMKIPRERLIEALEACEVDKIDLTRRGDKEARFLEAKSKVSELKRELGMKEEKEEEEEKGEEGAKGGEEKGGEGEKGGKEEKREEEEKDNKEDDCMKMELD